MQFSTRIVLNNIEAIKLKDIIEFYKKEKELNSDDILKKLELNTIISIEKKIINGSKESIRKIERLNPKPKINLIKHKWLRFKLSVLDFRKKFFKVKDYEDKSLLIYQEFINLRKNKK